MIYQICALEYCSIYGLSKLFAIKLYLPSIQKSFSVRCVLFQQEKQLSICENAELTENFAFGKSWYSRASCSYKQCHLMIILSRISFYVRNLILLCSTGCTGYLIIKNVKVYTIMLSDKMEYTSLVLSSSLFALINLVKNIHHKCFHCPKIIYKFTCTRKILNLC